MEGAIVMVQRTWRSTQLARKWPVIEFLLLLSKEYTYLLTTERKMFCEVMYEPIPSTSPAKSVYKRKWDVGEFLTELATTITEHT